MYTYGLNPAMFNVVYRRHILIYSITDSVYYAESTTKKRMP